MVYKYGQCYFCIVVVSKFACKTVFLHLDLSCLQSREARRLREFLEDYDDERDDQKFYK